MFGRRKPPVHFYADKTTGMTPAVGGSQEKTEAVRAEVAPLDWHTLQAEGPARRPIGVLPVDKDRNSDGLRGKHCGCPASRAREPDGGEE
jgi:hypothetical protein